jgi:orotidine-5'-phosphate decarboxylase
LSSLPARERIIVAFDVQTNEDYNFLVENLNGIATYVKVGMEIFYAKGEGIIKELQEQGFKIFLDLKIHDIPNTMMNSVKALTRLGVDIINVHASAGLEGMNAARVGRNEGMQEYGIDKKPLLIAVTQLTSTNQETLETEIGIKNQCKKWSLNMPYLQKELALMV